MKLAGREAARFVRSPQDGICGVLLHGADAGQVAAARRNLIAALMGGETDDLRLTRIEASEARKDAASVADALRAQGFFPGRRVVLIEGGTDGMAKPLGVAVEGLLPEDAVLVVTADALPARSALRKLFEGQRALMSLQFFQDAPSAGDIEDALGRAGLTCGITREAVEALAAIGSAMDHGSFAQFLELVALHGLDREAPLDVAEVEALAPAGLDGEVGELVDAVANGAARKIGPLLRRLGSGGAQPVTILLALQRHFRQLLTVANAEGGTEKGISALRPPLWGPRRNAVLGQVRSWRHRHLEQANRLLFEADGKIRSSQQAPDMALIERCALRLALMAGR